MADRLFSRINIKRRAFSWRPARSSMVMGVASPRSVRSAAMAGGRDLSASAAWASEVKATLAPAAREPVCRKRRREIMKARRKEDAFCRLADGQFSKKLSEKQLSTATLSYSPTFVIG